MRRLGAVAFAAVLGLVLAGCGANSSKTSAHQTTTRELGGNHLHVTPRGRPDSASPGARSHSQPINPAGSRPNSHAGTATSGLPPVICVGPRRGIADWQPTKRDVEKMREADRRSGFDRDHHMPSQVTGRLLPGGKVAGACLYGAGFSPNDY